MTALLRASFTVVYCIALLALYGCESSNGGGSGSVSVGYYGGYYGGYYPGYPVYWYDDDGPVVINPPENRPDRPTTLPAQPSQLPASRPSGGARPTPTMSRPAPRPMPRARGR